MRRYIAFFVLCLVAVTGVFAQNRNVAKKLFSEGNYVEAKPMFEQLLNANPKNSEYNYWYAVCCIETGDTVDVEDMLEFAASRKITNAFRYLGDWYCAKRDYSLAVENFSEFIGLTKDDSLRNVAQQKINFCERLDRMVRNCEVVCIVDSIVVDKPKFLSAYVMGNDVGRLATCAEYFYDEDTPGHINETERGMDIFFSDENDDEPPLLKLFHCSKIGDQWGNVLPIEGFDTKGNDDYPFMLADGVTLYFASDGEGSIGGYDIFVSRMDTESGRFYRPENVGMPFNSTANDYMMAINEVANLGWFATDRNQPEGKVCIYVFIPNAESVRVDVDAIGFPKALALADISSIADTHADADAVRKAQQQMRQLVYSQQAGQKDADFFFIIDDLNNYTSLSDFKSKKAREMFQEWLSASEHHKDDVKQLEYRREEYALSSASARAKMRDFILKLEKKVENDAETLKVLEYEVRRLEQEKLYGNSY